jgi:energy-coupling factor transporter ATP-binding protein EcfA2
VRNVERVNALAPGQTLKFAQVGLTAIYGDNGSGKSGYTRVLKTVCRARGAAPTIHPNIFDDTSVGTPRAEIGYTVGNQQLTHDWKDRIPGPDALAGISIFDTVCASVYVEGKTDVAFRPLGLDLFPKLARVADQVKAAINGEIARLGSGRAFREFQEGTTVGKLVGNLGKRDAPTSVERLAQLSEAEAKRLSELGVLITDLNASDPKRRAAEHRLQARRFRALLQHVQRIEGHLSTESAEALQTAREAAAAAAEVSLLASGEAFATEPVHGVGTNPWKELWECARRYSQEEAYPDLSFPVTAEGASCVLCHQPITPGTGARLRRFEEYVRLDAQKTAGDLTAVYDATYAPIQELSVKREEDENVLAELLARDEATGTLIASYLAHMQSRLDALRTACASGGWEGVTPPAESPCSQLLTVIKALEQTVTALEQAGEVEGSQALRAEYAELLDRDKLRKLKDEVLTEIARQQRIAVLRSCLKDTDTTGITTKSTELTKSVVTAELRGRFDQELRDLDLRRLSVSVGAEHGAKGVMFHKVCFDDAKTSGWGVQEVLSEGEHRCIALAAFLAELSLQTDSSTVVFDDPVSSLDHTRREYVAQRLVREAAIRPVVVLTHDIVFLLFLQEQSEKQGVDFTSSFLDRQNAELGVPVDGLPWYGMSLKKRIAWLRQEAVRLHKVYKDQSTEDYNKESSYLWGRLREAWECGVEEILLNGAIRRFGREVSTKPLRLVHDISEDDIDAVEAGMTESSKWLPGHDQASALNSRMPPPDVFSAAVEDLESWRAQIIKRREKKKSA